MSAERAPQFLPPEGFDALSQDGIATVPLEAAADDPDAIETLSLRPANEPTFKPSESSVENPDVVETLEDVALETAEPSVEPVKQGLRKAQEAYREASFQNAEVVLARAELAPSPTESFLFYPGDQVIFSGVKAEVIGTDGQLYVLDLVQSDGAHKRLTLRKQDMESFAEKQKLADRSRDAVSRLLEERKITPSAAKIVESKLVQLSDLLGSDPEGSLEVLSSPSNEWIERFVLATSTQSNTQRETYLQGFIDSARDRLNGLIYGSLSELFEPGAVAGFLERMRAAQARVENGQIFSQDSLQEPLDVLMQLQQEGMTDAEMNERIGYKPKEASSTAQEAQKAQLLLLTEIQQVVMEMLTRAETLKQSTNKEDAQQGQAVAELAHTVLQQSIEAMQPANEEMRTQIAAVKEALFGYINEVVEDLGYALEPAELDESQIPETRSLGYLDESGEESTPETPPPAEAVPPGFQAAIETFDLDGSSRTENSTEGIKQPLEKTVEIEFTEGVPGYRKESGPARSGSTVPLESSFTTPSEKQEPVPTDSSLNAIRSRIAPVLERFERRSPQDQPLLSRFQNIPSTLEKLRTMDDKQVLQARVDVKSWNPFKRRRAKKQLDRVDGLVRTASIMIDSFDNALKNQKQAA